MANSLPSSITVTGLDQVSLVKYLENIQSVVNELQTDHATFRTTVNANTTAINAIIAAATTDSATAIAAVSTVSTTAPAALTNSTALTMLKG